MIYIHTQSHEIILTCTSGSSLKATPLAIGGVQCNAKSSGSELQL